MSDQLDFGQEFSDQFEPQAEEPVEPQPIVIGDREFAPGQVDSIVQFTDWVNANPEGWQQLQEWEAGRANLVPADQQYQPQYQEPVFQEPEPEDYYSEDYLRGLGQRQAQLEQELNQRKQAEAAGAVEEGISRFMSSHQDLAADDIEKVLGWVADNNVLTSIPENSPYSHKTAETARKLEDAYRVVFYDRSAAEGRKQVVRDLAQRRRASSSSSAPSSPRVAPAPTTRDERRQAMTDEIAQALAEGGGN